MTSPVDTLLGALNDFVDQESPLVLSIQVGAEHLQIATRVVAGLERGDARRIMAFPHPTDGDTVAEYFEAWAASIDDAFEDAVPQFAKLRDQFSDVSEEAFTAVPARPEYDGRLDPPAAFTAWIERVAELSRSLAKQLLVVTYADDELPADIRAGLVRFGKMLASRRVRLIVMDASTTPLFADDTAAFQRVTKGSLLSIEADAAARFREFVRSDFERVLVADGASNLEPFLALVPNGAVTVRAPYRGRAAFEEALWRGLAETLGLKRDDSEPLS